MPSTHLKIKGKKEWNRQLHLLSLWLLNAMTPRHSPEPDMTWQHRQSTALLTCCTQIFFSLPWHCPFQCFLWPPSPSAVRRNWWCWGSPWQENFCWSLQETSPCCPHACVLWMPLLVPKHPTKCHHWSFSMGSTCSFHYNYPITNEKTSRYPTWLKTNHQAKIRNKFSLVIKALSQADCFGMTNSGLLAQV